MTSVSAVPAISGVLESAVYVEDLDATEAFYAGVLGLQRIARVDGRHAFFRCGAGVVLTFVASATRVAPAEGALPVPTHGATGEGHICFAMSASDQAVMRKHLEAEGVAIDADFAWPNGARSLYVRDPAGNSIEFAEPKLWGLE
ncbi:VOC family protein [Tropicimonas isoalkanivorans]|uniref:Catechol 2,3-dioxygenase n=1 Tax=Tropicimonas isoalkanivorans TaxID=441112 RepID=A0A1I1GFT8_9RHOB|nr:VOC family protein [Tropicimonas isoalkanivorans]SFC10285.1 Catechol 2,3-dioxygenase [Tropicimonas isoalkanivorans]